jgi:glycosyltransferase involved in cell wall biosynthesis
MRIVHVIPSLAKGGAERVVIDLANTMTERGHEVAIVTARPTLPELRAGELHGSVEVRVMDETGSRFGQYARLPSWMHLNREWLFSRDVLHCHLTFGAAFGMIASFLREPRQPPVIVGTYHSVGMPIPTALRATHAALLKFGDAAAFMAEAPYWQSFRTENPQLLTALIENGVTTEPVPLSAGAASAYRQAAGIPENALVVGTVGRLQAERRPQIILETFAKLIARNDQPIHLLIAGDGPERKRLQVEAARLGLQDRVHLPGLVQDPRLAFASIDLYVTLNVGRVTGVAALEAAAFGTPVIGFQMIDDRAERDTDWIWSSPNTDRLAERARELIADPHARAALAERQRHHVIDHLGIDAMANAYEDLYAQALRRRGVGESRAYESVSRCQ